MADLKKRSVTMCLAGLAVLYFCIFLPSWVLAADGAEERAMTEYAAAGIIEVQSGFLDGKGKFWQMKSGSGFLIANKESATYIITNCSNVSNTPNKIKKYCKKNSIDTENMQLSNYIQIIVKGDVTAKAEVVTKSEEKDYCILSTANVVSQKEPLKLGDSAGVEANDLVYAYGFPKEKGTETETMEYSELDVQTVQGAVTDKEAHLDDGVFLSHSAPVEKGYEGGPLLAADGYVVGLNCKQPSKDGTGVAYALPINEIRVVLDNFSIYYGSKDIDEAYAQLEAAYQECVEINQAGGYKRAEALEEALAAAEEALRQEEPYALDLQEACQALAEAKAGLVPKMKLLAVIIRVLAVCDFLLFLWLLFLVIMNAKEKKQEPENAGQQKRTRRQEENGQKHSASQPTGKGLRLVRQKTGQEILINKNQFVLGKSESVADFCIKDNQMVSRKHAVLFEKDSCWHIDDLNSLNGTYVNGSKLTPGQAAKLRDKDKVALANEEFLVRA